METTLPIAYPLEECGLPVEASVQPSGRISNEPNMFIFSLEGEFSLKVWDCKGKCYIENYTMVSGINFVEVDLSQFEEEKHAYN